MIQPDEFPTEAINNEDNDDSSVLSDESEIPDREILCYTMYVVFDLETTGLCRKRNHIIEIAGQMLDPLGNAYGDAFESLVNPFMKLSSFITNLTGITNRDLYGKPGFVDVVTDFFKFIKSKIRQYEEERSAEQGEPFSIERIVFVAHNGTTFDIPFLFNKIKTSGLDVLNNIISKMFLLDTCTLAKNIIKKRGMTQPANYQLGTLFTYVTGKDFGDGHRALYDVNHTLPVLKHGIFWYRKDNYIFKINPDGSIDSNKTIYDDLNDSDTDDSDDEKEEVLESVDEDGILEDSSQPVVTEGLPIDAEEVQQVVGWRRDTPFYGVNDKELFEEKLRSSSTTRNNNNEPLLVGLKCSSNSVNSPPKAWNAIFTRSLIQRIVDYTNDYGNDKAPSWKDVDRSDFINFICILFISGVQKRKDRISNWWSDNPLLENPIVKRIMTGREFHTMLRYLHCCPLENPDIDSPNYNPAYKMQEVMDILQTNYDRLFVPGQTLSLDESLIRAFGRIKFKVRIITKAARYGIKLYVLTDAETSFVLRIIIYTGKSTYDERYNDMKKTVQIVRRLLDDYSGSYRTVYVDRFYTSMDLVKELDEMDLFVTGTIQTSQFPKEFKIESSSAEFKNMERGDHKCHKYTYFDSNNQPRESGLVAWKDRNMVYMLTNNCNTAESTMCNRRTLFGDINIKRPNVISEYNKYMGGVDLADMRRLNCNSTIMCQNRWWLKLFFYTLDVATANALVIYQSAINDRSMNVVEFKIKLLQYFLGAKAMNIVAPPSEVEHKYKRLPGAQRFRCAYCSLQGIKSRTRFICGADCCQIPLCKFTDDVQNEEENDCFFWAHSNKECLRLTKLRYEQMQKSVTKKNSSTQKTKATKKRRKS